MQDATPTLASYAVQMVEQLNKRMLESEHAYILAKSDKISAEAEIETLQRHLNSLSHELKSPQTQLSQSDREEKNLEEERLSAQLAVAQKRVRWCQVSIDAYDFLKKDYNRWFNVCYPPNNSNLPGVDSKTLSLVQELWTLLKSATRRPSLKTSCDPILKTITLPEHLCWPIGASGHILFVRRPQEEVVKDIMAQYHNHYQRNCYSLAACYGCIVRGTPGIGK